MNQAFEQSILRNLHRIEKQDLTTYLKRFFNEKNLLQKTMDALSSAIIILDKDNHIVNYNRSALFLVFSKNLNPIGKPVLNCCAHLDLEIALTKLLSEGLSSEYMEINVFDKISKDFFISLFHFDHEPMNEVDDPKSINPHRYKVLLLNDITDWKSKNLAEDQKKSIDSLQTLTAGIAHEIKNPLTAIDLHLQLIKRFIKTELQQQTKLHHWVDVVSEEIKRLEAIVNDFLFSFRPMKPIKTPQKLNDIIQEVVEVFEPQCQEKKIRIATQLDPEIKSFLFDKNQIKQALINLIHNSIAAIEENSAVEGKGVISINTKENGQTIEVVITDNGVGIPASKVNEVFKPFFTTKNMGTGLGLSIISRIIHEHRGEIILNTDYKEGTQFFLEFSRLPPIHKIKQIPYRT